ncbi:MAG: hypothetical protein HY744_08030 [Deltaproteobacteria bacterium]|nr:hypothetical protein [Deltaproteobacteria bacterium]
MRTLGLGAAVLWAPSCEQPLDTTRELGRRRTLGEDIYGTVCDRLGASAFTEDLAGASYRAVCHADAAGRWGDDVDESVLPKPRGEAAGRARVLSLAKLRRLAQYRPQLIKALDATFPDVVVADPTVAPGSQIRLHDALLRFSQDITRLYEGDPYGTGQPVMPGVTQALGRLFDRLASGPAREQLPKAVEQLQKIAGRRGYRPFHVAMGAVAAALRYPALRPMLRSLLEALAPGGRPGPELEQLLSATRAELQSAQVTLSPQPAHKIEGDAKAAQPNRPRSTLEMSGAVLLDEHDAYAGFLAPATKPPLCIARRDRRGFVVPAGNEPGVPGTVPLPFADGDGDGLADVDGLGRFVDGAGQPLGLAPPFRIPGAEGAQYDAYDRLVVDSGGGPSLAYGYVDTRRTLAGRLLGKDLEYLVDPNRYAAPDDPAPWLSEHETLMYALSGLRVLSGPRELAQYEPATEQVLPADSSCDGCIRFRRFRAEDSPLPDLLHALGQILADPRSDALLLGLLDLVENHEQVVARLVGALLRVKEIADEHDALAAQGKEPKAEVAYDVPVWDEMAELVGQIGERPGLVARLLRALADPRVVQSHQQDPLITGAPAQHMGETLAAFVRMRDRFTYNQHDLNGPAINATDGYPSLANPHNPVDRGAPISGDNRSMLERSMQLIADGNRVRACNKSGAKVYSGMFYLPFTYGECELFDLANVDAMYVDSTLPSNHPKRMRLEIEDAVLSTLLDWVKGVQSPDVLFEYLSGIDGLTLKPEPEALNRLMFFGALSQKFGKLPDYDVLNEDSTTAKFISGTLEPVGGIVCPPKPNGVPECDGVEDVLRTRDFATIFGWERLGFLHYLRPTLRAFAEVGCNADASKCTPDDYTGENIFADIISTMSRHWPGPDHGPYCDASGKPASNLRYCSEAGLNRYEPILADAFLSDLVPALHELALVATELSEITIARGPDKGTVLKGSEVLEHVAQILFSKSYAAGVGLVDRHGNKATTWVDGTPQPQATVYTLFADALHRMDQRFAQACSCEGLGGDELASCQSAEQACLADAAARRGKWKRARSQLVDQFLAVVGTGPQAAFANPGTPRALARVLRLVREQLNANCPKREYGEPCVWARQELGRKLGDVLGRPLHAAICDLGDALATHEPARRELERFLGWLALEQDGVDALQGLLASLGDLLQVLANDEVMAPILSAASTAAGAAGDAEGPGVADRLVVALWALSGDEYDRYHVLDYVLPNLLTPVDGGQGPTPIETVLDAIADIDRLDAASADPLARDDYAAVFRSVDEFFRSDTRGFEQLYYIVRNRPRE